MRSAEPGVVHCVRDSGADENQQGAEVASSESFAFMVSDEEIGSSVAESSTSCHPATQKLLSWHNGFFRCLRYIPVLGNALVGFGPRFVLTLNLSVLLSKGLANNILYYTFLPVFLYRLNCGLQLYQRLDAVGGIGWSMKPLIAVLSDVAATFGYRRRWLLMFSTLLACVCSICYSSLPGEEAFIAPAAVFYTVANYGMANLDVLTEGIYSQRIRETPVQGVFLVSGVWWMNMLGTLIGAFIQGPVSDAGHPTVGGWVAAACELVLLPFIALNWMEEAPSRMELGEASSLAPRGGKDVSESSDMVREISNEELQCPEKIHMADPFGSLMDDATNSCAFCCGSENISINSPGKENLSSGLLRADCYGGPSCLEKVKAIQPASFSVCSSSFVSSEEGGGDEGGGKGIHYPVVKDPSPPVDFPSCSIRSSQVHSRANHFHGSSAPSNPAGTGRGVKGVSSSPPDSSSSVAVDAGFSSSSTVVLCRYPCFEVNHKAVSSQWRIIVFSIGLTLGVVALAVLTVVLKAYYLLLALAVLSCLCIGLLFWALPPIIAKAGLFIFLNEAAYTQLSGPLNSFCLAGPSCVPGGPHFDFTLVYTVATAVGSVAGLLGITLFAYFFSYRSYRFNFFVLTVLRAAASIFDLILVRRWNLLIGIPDIAVYLVGDAVIYQLVNRLSWMPVALLISQLCPRGSEAMVYALLAAMSNLGSTVATEVGVVLMSTLWPVDFSASDGESCAFQNLWKLIVVGHIGLALLVLPFIFVCIPNQKVREAFWSSKS